MADWQQTRLGEISRIYSGFAFRSQDLGEKGIPVVKIANIQNKRVSPECADHLPEELCTEKLNRYFLQPDDTLIAMTGAGSVGKVGKMPRADERFLVNQRVAIVRPDNSRCNPAFVYFALSQDFYETKLYGLGLGAGQPNVSAKQIGELEIPFPPLPVQRRIAGILSAYDELVENNQRRIKILEEMARAVYREWFVEFRFPKCEKVNLVDSSLGKIPHGWEVKKLGEILELNYGKALKQEDRSGGVVPVYGSSGVVGYHDTALVKGPGIVIGRKGNVGSVFWSDESFYPIDTAYFVTSEVPLRFLFYDLQTKNFLNNDAAVPGLNRNQAYSLETTVPPPDLLARFCKLADDFECQASTLQRQTQNLRQTRDLLLPRLLSGQINLSEVSREEQIVV
jgi:type I restriction enzyme, S subunit